MKKTLLSIIVLFLFSIVSVSASFEVRYGSYPEYVEEEQIEEPYYLNVVNSGRTEIDDVQVGVYIPDLDYYERSGTFDAEERDTRREMFIVNLVDAEPGYYPVRLSMYSDDDYTRRVRWTWVAVV